MKATKVYAPYEEFNFKTIDEFKDRMNRGDEIEFEWKGKLYRCFGRVQKDEKSPAKKLIIESCYEKDGKFYNDLNNEEVNREKTDLWCDTLDEILEYIVGGDRLRDVITQVTVTSSML